MNRIYESFKNAVTNLLGLTFWGFAIYELTKEESDYIYICVLVIIGVILFRYKITETKKIINNLIVKDSVKKRLSGGEAPIIDDEETDA